MYNLLFGRKRRVSRKKIRKIPAKIRALCRKFKIKCTKKVGKRRVNRSLTVLKKLIKKRMKSQRTKRTKRVRSVRQRRSRFGSAIGDFSNAGPSNYGYNQKVKQYPGTLSQSSQMVTSSTNQYRPTGLGLPGEYIPTYGVNRPFFTESVPTQVGPNWNFMGQPDGTMYPVGGPFVGYRSPAFGKETPKSSYAYKVAKYAATKTLNKSPHYVAAKYVAKKSGLMFGKKRVCRNCTCTNCRC